MSFAVFLLIFFKEGRTKHKARDNQPFFKTKLFSLTPHPLNRLTYQSKKRSKSLPNARKSNAPRPSNQLPPLRASLLDRRPPLSRMVRQPSRERFFKVFQTTDDGSRQLLPWKSQRHPQGCLRPVQSLTHIFLFLLNFPHSRRERERESMFTQNLLPLCGQQHPSHDPSPPSPSRTAKQTNKRGKSERENQSGFCIIMQAC